MSAKKWIIQLSAISVLILCSFITKVTYANDLARIFHQEPKNLINPCRCFMENMDDQFVNKFHYFSGYFLTNPKNRRAKAIPIF